MFKYLIIFLITFTTINSEELTLSIIKPDAVKNKHIGEIINRFEKNNLQIAAMKLIQITPEQAAKFYAIHKNKPFYNKLVNFISSSPSIVIVLKGHNAVKKNREIMGSTNPKDAKPNTIRHDFAESIDKNAVHGSDSPENAKNEIAFFFSETEIVN